MKVKSYLPRIYKFGIIFVCLIVFYVLSMTIAYTIPNSRVQNNTEKSLQVIENEGTYPRPFFNTYGSQLDNATDKLMFEKTIREGNLNPLQSGVSINGYYRYWHGYQIFLRPMLLMFSYVDIRFINAIVFFITFGITFALLKDKLGYLVGISFITAMMMAYSFIVPMSIQFMSIFMIMMLSMIVILHFYNRDNFNKNLIYLFFIIGSVTSFMDLLTAPLLTLGVPLTVLILLILKAHKTNNILTNIIDVIKYSASWAVGYGVTWATKWLVASIVLGVNALQNAEEAISFRTQGNQQYPLNHLRMYRINLKAIMPSAFVKIAIVILIVWVILFILYRKNKRDLLNVVPLLIIGAFPYAWFYALGNHSEIHFWFTYRIQIITAFSIFVSMIYCIDFTKIAMKFNLKNKTINIDV